ncbi:Maintenance of ploidy protein mob2 [Homalodisca vitripennis]|nr:Maintenance of ploidy protein mob2 [Homalodisca vitripennis]
MACRLSNKYCTETVLCATEKPTQVMFNTIMERTHIQPSTTQVELHGDMVPYQLLLVGDANEFPSSFESIVRKILRLLFHVLAHLYHCHFREVVLLNLHAHLNCVFAHLTLFNARFELIEARETEILNDLVIALKILEPEPPAEVTEQVITTNISSAPILPENTALLLANQEVIAQIGH